MVNFRNNFYVRHLTGEISYWLKKFSKCIREIEFMDNAKLEKTECVV